MNFIPALVLCVIGVIVAPLPEVKGYRKCKYTMASPGGGAGHACPKDYCPIVIPPPGGTGCSTICSNNGQGTCRCHCCTIGGCTEYTPLKIGNGCTEAEMGSDCADNCGSQNESIGYHCKAWGKNYCFCSTVVNDPGFSY